MVMPELGLMVSRAPWSVKGNRTGVGKGTDWNETGTWRAGAEKAKMFIWRDRTYVGCEERCIDIAVLFFGEDKANRGLSWEKGGASTKSCPAGAVEMIPASSQALLPALLCIPGKGVKQGI